jgi:hypothetical protein
MTKEENGALKGDAPMKIKDENGVERDFWPSSGLTSEGKQDMHADLARALGLFYGRRV